MTQETVKAIEENIRQAKVIAGLGDSLERLRLNKDFKEVVLKGYFEQEAIRLVHLKADPGMQSPDIQKSIIAQMDAIGSVSQYFTTVFQKASIARKAIAADEETRDEILAEGDN
jgi:CHAT domain-containing protein